MSNLIWAVVMAGTAAAAEGGTDLVQRDLEWVCVNDTVMGGVSQSRVARDDEAVVFTGTLSLENNGGFTSVRTAPAELSLAEVGGFRLRVEGDSRRYAFTARRADVPLRGGSYRASFSTTAGEETVIELPLSAFQATAFGRPVPGAPALAAADVGLAMGTGTDVAIESAGMTLTRGDLSAIVRARKLARATMRNIRQNLFFSFLINGVGVPVAAGVLYPVAGILLSPMLAGAAMALSSFTVVLNALRLNTVKL